MPELTFSHDEMTAVLSGQDRSPRGRFLRAVTSVIEPFYASVMRARNAAYSQNMLIRTRLPRPTISVGNITTGGTGKTPVVQWLASRLRDAGRRPAVLMRGYKIDSIHDRSDEEMVLDSALNSSGVQPPVPVEANPNRVAGAVAVLTKHPDTDVLLLDDGFQHRRVRRDFDLVLVNATAPFGFDHVLPRGLLREPLSGLRRASAFIITRSSLVDAGQLQSMRTVLSRFNPVANVLHADHVHTNVWTPATDDRQPIDAIRDQRVYAFYGVGDPSALHRQILETGCELVGRRVYKDHHPYTSADVDEIVTTATAVGASSIITTQKDWVKIREMPQARGSTPSMRVLELGIRFHNDDDQRLLSQIEQTIGAKKGCTVEG